MVPSENSSARKQRLGHITKEGNCLLRFLLVEAAQAAVRTCRATFYPCTYVLYPYQPL